MAEYRPVPINELPSEEAGLSRSHVVPVSRNGKAGKASIAKILSFSTSTLAKLYATMFVDVPVETVTNLILRSEEFDNAAWVKTGATVSANAGVAPDGAVTMDKIVKANGQSLGYLSQSQTVAFGKRYVFSFFAKAAEISQIAAFLSQGALPAVQQIVFNLSTGEVENASAYDGGIEDWGNGTFRCYLISSLTINAGSVDARIYPAADGALNLPTGNGVDGVLVWGAQFQEASKLGSYVKTTTAAVTASFYSALHYAAKATSSVGPAIRDSANKSAMVDADRLALWDTVGAVLSYITIPQLIARIFQTTRKISNGYFLSNFRLWDAAANTKGLAFDLSSITAGQVRTIKMPDGDVNLSGIGSAAGVTVTPSGSATDLTGIPAAVQEVTLIFNGVTVSAASNPALRLGSGSVQSSGYNAKGVAIVSGGSPGILAENTAFVGDVSASSSGPFYGIIRLTRSVAGANTWVVDGSLNSATGNNRVNIFTGAVTLAGELDRVQFTTLAGTPTLGGANSLNIRWKF